MQERIESITSTCIPMCIDNCNTDLIIPARYLAATTRDPRYFGEAFMRDLRYGPDGHPQPAFVLNRPPFDTPPREGVNQIIVAGRNWGSGSSREHAAWAIAGYGIRAVVSSSIADIHRNNLLNCGVLPVVVSDDFCRHLLGAIADDASVRVCIDLPTQTITSLATGRRETFPISAYKKHCLMHGLDDIDFLLQSLETHKLPEQEP